jgi:hypothetical protein
MALMKLVRLRSGAVTALEAELWVAGESRSLVWANRTSLELNDVGRVEKESNDGRLEGTRSDSVDSETEDSR